MSYLPISVKEAINNINAKNNGWFLPAVQRPYVWGSRYENESYICKLFDSILKGYPIGSLIIWNTEDEIPYREFISDYKENEISKLVDKGLYGRKDKWLIYDGQQRLQTLYSCLCYSFNDKILCYDVLFDLESNHESDITGFLFKNKNEDIKPNLVRMNELFVKTIKEKKSTYRNEIINRFESLTTEEKVIIEDNIDILWNVFVDTDKKSLSYFAVDTKSEGIVNEVFERLNTGGMELTLSDLLFSKIKEEYPSYEEILQDFSKKIYNSTLKGIIYNAYNILQIVNLIVKGTARIDPKKVKNEDIKHFIETWDNLENALLSFFTDYLYGQFKINNISIIPRKNALLPLIVYFFEFYRKGGNFTKMKNGNLLKINKFFIKSQINDWSLQSYIDKFTGIIKDCALNNDQVFDFPLDEIEEFIKEKNVRNVDIFENTFIGYEWFALKVLMPSITYQFDPDIKGRFNPEIDHIFPKKLKDQNQDYVNLVDILWNMQPVKGEINSLKTNRHPKDFFGDTSKTKNNETICGSKYLNEYEFIEKNLDHDSWNDPAEFIKLRKEKMIIELKTKYGIILNNIYGE